MYISGQQEQWTGLQRPAMSALRHPGRWQWWCRYQLPAVEPSPGSPTTYKPLKLSGALCPLSYRTGNPNMCFLHNGPVCTQHSQFENSMTRLPGPRHFHQHKLIPEVRGKEPFPPPLKSRKSLLQTRAAFPVWFFNQCQDNVQSYPVQDCPSRTATLLGTVALGQWARRRVSLALPGPSLRQYLCKSSPAKVKPMVCVR